MEVIVQNISKSFLSKPVINNLSFRVNDSSIVSLTGKNASGKSTVLKIISGLLKPDYGSVTYLMNNKKIKYNTAKQHIGFAANNELVIENMNAFEYFNFIRKIYRIPKNIFDKNIKRLLDAFKIDTEIFTKVISTYSTGYQKITEIIGVLLHDPDLILLDEPFSGLDADFTSILMDFIVHLKNEKHTIILATHNKDYALKSSDLIITL